MRKTTKLMWLLMALISFNSVSAEITVNPNQPNASQNIQIQVVNQYASDASINSESMVVNGQQIVINLTVDVVCLLPTAPTLTSLFEVGQLAPGDYEIVVETQHNSTGPGCSVADVNESLIFTVAGSGSVPKVPTGSFWGGLLFVFCVMLLSLMRFRKDASV